MKTKLKIDIEVFDINVEQTEKYDNGNGSGWYKFGYSIKKNDGKKKTGEIDGSWSSQTKSNFARVLKNGYACKLVLESLY